MEWEFWLWNEALRWCLIWWCVTLKWLIWWCVSVTIRWLIWWDGWVVSCLGSVLSWWSSGSSMSSMSSTTLWWAANFSQEGSICEIHVCISGFFLWYATLCVCVHSDTGLLSGKFWYNTILRPCKNWKKDWYYISFTQLRWLHHYIIISFIINPDMMLHAGLWWWSYLWLW